MRMCRRGFALALALVGLCAVTAASGSGSLTPPILDAEIPGPNEDWSKSRASVESPPQSFKLDALQLELEALAPELAEAPQPIKEEVLALAESERNEDWEKLVSDLEAAQPHPAFFLEGKPQLAAFSEHIFPEGWKQKATKHVPHMQLFKQDGELRAKVSFHHGMEFASDKPHHITVAFLRDQRGHVIHMHHFDEKSVPEVTFSLKALSPSSTLVPFIHCNIYGLWAGTPVHIAEHLHSLEL